ncbi:MAG: hypothetical protein HY062_18220, partial [Bacteroidetes bacterium]|nr:hypothetical protein [Bacteroidota bacterium]
MAKQFLQTIQTIISMKKIFTILTGIVAICVVKQAQAQAPGIVWSNVATSYIGYGLCANTTNDG